MTSAVREYHLRTPLTEGVIRKLRVGDIVYLSGTVVTARDAAHKRILEYLRSGRRLPIDMNGLALYHCGPLVRKLERGWEVLSAGPTTSARMEDYEHEIIKELGVRMIIGKGGMFEKTAMACREYGAVYCIFTGGAGVLAARAITSIERVEWLDLGVPEALWVLRVEKFGPLFVTIDSTGRNLHQEIMEKVLRKINL
ncbi:MAG: FumA C-terminus/TtdB family hydratase beta subunit [Candidatus Baldrarchaeia archaeon]